MRVRTRVVDAGSPISGVFVAQHRDSSGSQWITETSPLWTNPTSGTTGSTTELCEDVSTKDAKRILAQGGILNNPLHVHVYIVRNPPVRNLSHHTTRMSNGQIIGYKFDGTVVPFAGSYSKPELIGWLTQFADAKTACINKAVTQAHANVNPSEILALASVAESDKTYRFLADTSKRVVKIAKDARKFKLKALRRQISKKELKDRYMECRYALRPLAYDVGGVIDTIRAKRGSIRKTYWGNDAIVSEFSDTILGRSLWYETICDITRKATYTCSARAGVLCSSDRGLDDIVGLHQIPQTLWELTPLSFVVDWFGNVGQTIGAWTPKVGVNQLASWVSVKQTYARTNTAGSIRSSASAATWTVENTSTMSGFDYGQEEVILERFVEPSLSIWPQAEIRVDQYKLLDLGIMLRQFSKRI